MSWILDGLFGNRLAGETDRYLHELSQAPLRASRANASELLRRLAAESGTTVVLGETLWGEPVAVPLQALVKAYGLVTGGMGSGKSMFALLVCKALVDQMPYARTTGFGVLDAKGDLFLGTLFLLMERLEHLAQHDPAAARELRRRIILCDFASRDPVSPYNILARWPGVEPDFFASNRADVLLDLLPGGDHLSLSGAAVLQKMLLLLSEFNLPITHLDEVLDDELLRERLLDRSRNRVVTDYFARQFASVPKPTIAALRRRIEALFASEGVRLALAGNTAPDFRRFQDEGKIVLINCFGETISRSVRRLLQALVLSDIAQSVFARRSKDHPYLWVCDEAQNFFLTEKLRDNMSDLLTMSRSFGTYFLYLTQNMGTAVQDGRVLRILYTNIRWSFSMRGEPDDCAFLKPALPVTARKMRPQTSPFEEKGFYSISEERAMALDEVAQLPDRLGYLWLKSRAAEALKIKTAELAIPQGQDLELAVRPMRRDPSIGLRHSRKEYERLIGERDREWKEDEEADLGGSFAEAYKRGRGEGR